MHMKTQNLKLTFRSGLNCNRLVNIFLNTKILLDKNSDSLNLAYNGTRPYKVIEIKKAHVFALRN